MQNHPVFLYLNGAESLLSSDGKVQKSVRSTRPVSARAPRRASGECRRPNPEGNAGGPIPKGMAEPQSQRHSATHYQNCDISHTADWEHKYKKKPHIRAQSLKGLRDWEHKTFILTGKCSQSAEPQSKINLDIQNSFPKFVTHSIIHQSARVEG